MISMSESTTTIMVFLGSSQVAGSEKQHLTDKMPWTYPHQRNKAMKHNKSAPAKTVEALSWCGKTAFLGRKICSHLVVLCGESLKTYGRINFGFGHVF